MGKVGEEFGFVRGVILLLLLLIVVGMFYLSRRRGVDVGQTGKDMVGDLEEAAESVVETSEDAFLTAKVKTALALSKSASALDIDVDSRDGTVTLTGTLPSEEAKNTVLQVARDTEGVLTVTDRIQIDPSALPRMGGEELERRLADLEIEVAIYERLLRADDVDVRSIRVSVDNRVVRLTGSVPDAVQRKRVTALVASVEGVDDVRDELEISDRAARVEVPERM